MKTATLLRSFCAILVFILVSADPAMAAADKDVNVINTPNVTVTNTPDVNVTNTPDVNVTNTPDVNVQSLPPVQIDSPTRIPYQVTVDADLATQWSNVSVPVPSGYLLVIENVSCYVFLPPDVKLTWIALYTHASSTSGRHYINIPETTPDYTGSTTYAGGQAVRLYADQNFLVRFIKVGVGSNPPDYTQGTASVGISGYLVPLDTTSLSP